MQPAVNSRMCSPASHCQQSSCMEKESKDIDRPHEQLDPQALSVLGLTSRNAILKSLDATVSPSSLSITVSRRSPPPVFFPPAVRSAIGSRTPHCLETSRASRRSVPAPEDGKLDVANVKGGAADITAPRPSPLAQTLNVSNATGGGTPSWMATSLPPTPTFYPSLGPSTNSIGISLGAPASIPAQQHRRVCEQQLQSGMATPNTLSLPFVKQSSVSNMQQWNNTPQQQTAWSNVLHLASLGVGVGPGVNPEMRAQPSGPGARPSTPNLRPPAPPIINTGNLGPMCVQPGDWICSVCSFVNWRRRKVCMRCFPFAEGNEVAASLASGALIAAQLAAGISPNPTQMESLAKVTRHHRDPTASGDNGQNVVPAIARDGFTKTSSYTFAEVGPDQQSVLFGNAGSGVAVPATKDQSHNTSSFASVQAEAERISQMHSNSDPSTATPSLDQQLTRSLNVAEHVSGRSIVDEFKLPASVTLPRNSNTFTGAYLPQRRNERCLSPPQHASTLLPSTCDSRLGASEGMLDGSPYRRGSPVPEVDSKGIFARLSPLIRDPPSIGLSNSSSPFHSPPMSSPPFGSSAFFDGSGPASGFSTLSTSTQGSAVASRSPGKAPTSSSSPMLSTQSISPFTNSRISPLQALPSSTPLSGMRDIWLDTSSTRQRRAAPLAASTLKSRLGDSTLGSEGDVMHASRPGVLRRGVEDDDDESLVSPNPTRPRPDPIGTKSSPKRPGNQLEVQ